MFIGILNIIDSKIIVLMGMVIIKICFIFVDIFLLIFYCI